MPQLFYDMIGRFCPGAIVMVTAWMVYATPSVVVSSIFKQTTEKTYDHPILVYAILALAAYFIADMLNQIWLIWFKKYLIKVTVETPPHRETESYFDHWIKLNGSVFKNVCHPEITKEFIEKKELPRYIMLDYLRIYMPVEAVRLLKVKAEYRLSSVIVVGYSFLLIVNLLFMFLAFSYQGLEYEFYERLGFGSFLFACILLSSIRAIKSFDRFENGIVIAWLICVYDQTKNLKINQTIKY